MKQDRLRDDDAPWGPTRIEYARREQLRLRARDKKRAQRKRGAEGRFVAAPKPAPAVIGKVWAVQSFWGLSAVTVCYRDAVPMSLPFVSILHGSRSHGVQNERDRKMPELRRDGMGL